MHWMLYSGARKSAGLAGDLLAELVKDGGIGLGLFQLLVEVAQAVERQTFGRRPGGKRERPRFKVLDNLVDQATLESLSGADGVAAGHHLKGFGHTGHSR